MRRRTKKMIHKACPSKLQTKSRSPQYPTQKGRLYFFWRLAEKLLTENCISVSIWNKPYAKAYPKLKTICCRTPINEGEFFILCHEIGHVFYDHSGKDKKLRCVKEMEADCFAFEQFARFGIDVYPELLEWLAKYIENIIQHSKLRRGLKKVPRIVDDYIEALRKWAEYLRDKNKK